MKLYHLQEPLLEFGTGQHVDVRFGMNRYGPFDQGSATAPSAIRVGVVGTQSTTEQLRHWLEKMAEGVSGKETRLVNLFPAFPGFTDKSCFRSKLVFDDRWTSAITQREIDDLKSAPPQSVIQDSVEAFKEYGKHLLESNAIDVMICAPPGDLMVELDAAAGTSMDNSEEDIDEGSEESTNPPASQPPFHDLLKARGMTLGIPIQMIRPGTYGARTKRPRSGKQIALQDEATRAWNFFTALYYKAGGIPWRLLRDPSDLSACFAGISFYRSLDRERMLTSVAQVFNERGEGIIVRGGVAEKTDVDRQPHLNERDAYGLIDDAIQTFRREHRHTPARLVVHKTSQFSAGETDGVYQAAANQRIDVIDLVSVARSFTRLFRVGTYPPLRGTTLELDSDRAIVYLRGSVPFFEAYPGMYVPRPIEIRLAKSESTLRQISSEMLALSKLNWNNTQFDGGEPITVRAARRVGDILKCIPTDSHVVQPGFRYFM